MQDGEVCNFDHSSAIDEEMRRATVPPKAMAFHLTVLALAHTTESLPEPTEPSI